MKYNKSKSKGMNSFYSFKLQSLFKNGTFFSKNYGVRLGICMIGI